MYYFKSKPALVKSKIQRLLLSSHHCILRCKNVNDCVFGYLLSAGMYEEDSVAQAAVHLADVQFGGLHADHDPFLGDVEPQDRRAELGCGCEDLV